MTHNLLHSLDISNSVVGAPSLVDAEPMTIFATVIVTDAAKDLLGELAPAVVILDVHAVTASVLVQSRSPQLPSGLVASSPVGALRSVGADGQDRSILEFTAGERRTRIRRRCSGNSFAEGRQGNRGSDGEENGSLRVGHDISDTDGATIDSEDKISK